MFPHDFGIQKTPQFFYTVAFKKRNVTILWIFYWLWILCISKAFFRQCLILDILKYYFLPCLRISIIFNSSSVKGQTSRKCLYSADEKSNLYKGNHPFFFVFRIALPFAFPFFFVILWIFNFCPIIYRTSNIIINVICTLTVLIIFITFKIILI